MSYAGDSRVAVNNGLAAPVAGGRAELVLPACVLPSSVVARGDTSMLKPQTLSSPTSVSIR